MSTATPPPSPSASPFFTLVILPNAGPQPIYSFVQSATAATGLDMTMYELQDPALVTLLTTAAADSIRTRVILNASAGSQARNQTAFSALRAGGVTVAWASDLYEVTHQKTIRVGGQVMVLTANAQTQYYASSRDFAVILNDPVDAAAVQAVFEADLAGTPITPSNGNNLVWSPTNAKQVMLDIINGATATLLVESEEMSDPDVIAALCARAQAGVDVRVVMTNDPSWAAPFNTLTAAGVRVATYAADASLYIHAKVTLADAGLPTQHGFLGSENDGTVSLTENRELGIQFTDPTLIGQLTGVLSGDFAGATVWMPTAPALSPGAAGALAATLRAQRPAPTAAHRDATAAARPPSGGLRGRPTGDHELG